VPLIIEVMPMSASVTVTVRPGSAAGAEHDSRDAVYPESPTPPIIPGPPGWIVVFWPVPFPLIIGYPAGWIVAPQAVSATTAIPPNAVAAVMIALFTW
jgi:hypothetical protein